MRHQYWFCWLYINYIFQSIIGAILANYHHPNTGIIFHANEFSIEKKSIQRKEKCTLGRAYR